MMNPFGHYTPGNPQSDDPLVRLQIHQAALDERVRFNTWAIGVLVVMHGTSLGLAIVALA